MPLLLKIPGLPEWLCTLRKKGLFWIGSTDAEDRNIFLGQALSGLSEQTQVTLVYAAEEANKLLSSYRNGPESVRLFEIPMPSLHKALQHLPSELVRAKAHRSDLILLCLPAEAWAQMNEEALTHWCGRLRNWLEQHDSSLVIYSQGAVHPQLIHLNDYLSGLCMLTSEAKCAHYQVKFWHHRFGIQTEQKFCLERTPLGFEVSLEPPLPEPAAHQDVSYLIQAHVLKKNTQLHDHWLLFDTVRDLLQQAASVPYGILLLGIANNNQIEELAQLLHSQPLSPRQKHHILVKEITPCLRHRDRALLQACGVHLIIPHNFPDAQIMSVLDLLKQETNCLPKQLLDFQELKQSIDPPDQCGLISVQTFLTTLEPIYTAAQPTSMEHQLLQLTPSGELTASHCLRQMQLRRMGDIACIENKFVYLFLFACNTNEIEQALQNICQLPFNSLFSKIAKLDNLDPIKQTHHEHNHSVEIQKRFDGAITTNQDTKPEAPLHPQRAKLPCLSLVKKEHE